MVDSVAVWLRTAAAAPRGAQVQQRLAQLFRAWTQASLLLLISLLAACSSIPRGPAPPTLTAPVAPVGFPASVRFLGTDRDFVLNHADEAMQRLRLAKAGAPIDILALSGGGAGAAFGAGALIGMSRRGDRPRFDVVTGVSSGALIAPLAFLGPSWDGELAEAFDSDRAEHLLQRRGLSFLFRPGFYSSEPLVELVDHFVTDRLIKAIAEQAAQGRLLLVVTTDLDKEEAVIWDMGAIAAQGGPRARELFRDVLVASASIPGLFAPVLIHVEGGGKSYDEMHVDGGTTLSFFVASEVMQLESRHFQALDKARIFVLVNGQLNATTETTPEAPVSVLFRSFSAGLMHASRKTLELTAAFAERYQMEFLFTYIPARHAFAGPLDFSHDAMHSLFNYGAYCAEANQLWTTMEEEIEQGQEAATAVARHNEDCPSLHTRPTKWQDATIFPGPVVQDRGELGRKLP
jgi:predicted acylesterase/phospholipase RssA